MIKVFLITVLICLSEISFCQDSTQAHLDSLKDGLAKKEAAKKEADKKEAARKEAEKKLAAKKEADKKEADKKETAKKEAGKKAAQVKEISKKEAERKETEKKEADKREAADKETAKNEAEKKEADRKLAEKKAIEDKRKSVAVASGKEDVPIWLIAGFIISTAIAVVLFFKNRKMATENKVQGQANSNYLVIIDRLKELMSKSQEAQALIPVEKLEETLIKPVTGPPTPISYIKTEIILSAGPRKDTGNNDTELGEDIAGSVSLPGKTYFWILDGTSESFLIKGSDTKQEESGYEESHIFSSRLLAQSIGHFIQKNIYNYDPAEMPLDKLLTAAGKYVAEEWEKRLNNEPAEKKEAILEAIGKGFKPLCSTTAIVGCFYDDGHLFALRTGDSKIFPFKKSGSELTLFKNFKFTADPTGENDRIAFRLDYDEPSKAFIIKHNTPKWLTQSAGEIQSVFAFTDGIGRITEAQLSSDNPGIVEMIRQNIARIPQKTHDDKTLIILERINNAG
ncbi:MAG: hypothetical protein ABIQ31_12350 [Ferruginibacter sp.]